MDPFTIVTGIAGLISVSLQLTQLSYDYITSVRSASQSVTALHRELIGLQHVLCRLNQNILAHPDVKDAFADQASAVLGQPEDILKVCKDDLVSLKKKLTKRSSERTFTRLKAVLTWPFSEQATERKILQLHRYQELFDRVVNIDILGLVAETHQKVQQTKQSVQVLHNEVKDLRVLERNAKVIHWLSPLHFSSKQAEILAKRSKGTCNWLLKDPTFRSWLHGLSPSKILWCPGELGAGKTVITSLVISELTRACPGASNFGLGYLYCDYNAQLDQTPAAMLGSLIQQLAARASHTFLTRIENYYHKRDTNFLQSAEIALEMLIEASNHFSTMFLVVDALDEVENQSTRNRKQLLSAISRLLGSCANVRIFVTSRSHLEDINTAFRNADMVPIRARKDDVQSFLISRLEESQSLREILSCDPSFKKELISTIASKSAGQFLLPQLHMDRLCELTCLAEVEEELADMSKSVKATYEKTLKRLGGRSKERRETALETLMWVCASTRPLNFLELRDALAIQVDSRALDVRSFRSRRLIEEICLGLVKIEKQTQEVRLIHFTLEEYLRNKPDFVDEAHQKITAKLLTLLKFDTAQQKMLKLGLNCDSSQSRSMDDDKRELAIFDYAFWNWQYHARRCQRTPSSYILQYFATRPRVLHIYRSNQTLDMSELGKLEIGRQGWVALVYATLCGLHAIGKRLIKTYSHAAEFHKELGNPTVLSWVVHAFAVGKWYVRDKDPWMKVPKYICDSIELLFEDKTFFEKASEHDYQNLCLLLLKSPKVVMKHVLRRGFDVDRRQQFKLLSDVDYDASVDRRNFYATTRVLDGQPSQRYTVLAACYPTDKESNADSNGLSFFWIIMLSKYFHESTTTSNRDLEGHIECLLKMGANPDQLIGPNSFITQSRSTFPILSNPGYTPLHFAVSDLDHRLVSILLSAGATVNLADGEGLTALAGLRRDLSRFHHSPSPSAITHVICTLVEHGAAINQLMEQKCPSHLRVGQRCIWQTVIDVLAAHNSETDGALDDKRRRSLLLESFDAWYKGSIVTDGMSNQVICNEVHCSRLP